MRSKVMRSPSILAGLALVTFGSSAIAGSSAAAQSVTDNYDAYLEAGYSWAEINGRTNDAEFGGVVARLGLNFGQFLALEGESVLGLDDEEDVIAGREVVVSQEYSLAGFLRISYPISERLSVHARLGGATVALKAEAVGFEETENEEGFAYGIGASVAVLDPFYLRADYVRYDIEDSDTDQYTLTLGAKL
ncbi:putative outer membrane protein A [Parvularcula bermudensis HTCC2503]|uniref:Putative outer membrane protein A n=1 Tax=Parvularcula bermudensis (strain ATCC BAA-594 / HTCC2503 / KCTC 12087) TaxID=314260 RepID=E0TBT0_PARBH|nr:porin family protein [Parvularcula bermudensis]ADM08423.1 putative outer membrane protein A [Parvularcula bermudensis HTCC2503]